MTLDLEQNIARLIKYTGKITLTKLAGEASYREYYRAQLADSSTLMIMKMPGGISSASEEITKTTRQIDELPFVNMQRYLKGLSLPVPEIIALDVSEGIMVLQDLGDQSFESRLLSLDRSQWVGLYEKAIDLLGEFQKKTTKNHDEACIAFHRRFDSDLLLWELNHFLEYGVIDRLGRQIKAADAAEFKNIFEKIVAEIVTMPQTLVHRDFQSRNLMFVADDLYLIDFQDALMGPALYDMVALLRDSYVALSSVERSQLLKYYQKQSIFDAYQDFDLLQRHIDLITLQRKLKDAGRFQYIKTVKGNPKFMTHFPASIDYVNEALTRLPDFKSLADLLVQYV